MDGDKHRSQDEKVTQLRRSFTGTELDIEERRNQALSLIMQFIIPDRGCPDDIQQSPVYDLCGSVRADPGAVGRKRTYRQKLH